jgi:hypothetical protein
MIASQPHLGGMNRPPGGPTGSVRGAVPGNEISMFQFTNASRRGQARHSQSSRRCPLRIPSVMISAFGIVHDETGETTPSNASS